MEYTNKTGYIFIKTQNGFTKKVFEQLKSYDWVIGTWAVTGDYDIILWANAMNDHDLYTYATTVRGVTGVEYTNSHYVHDGYVADFTTFANPNGAWVRLRGDKLATVPALLKDYKYVGAYATIPGDYDYLVWTYGDNVRDTMEHVLKLTENRNWLTYTHVPVYTYFNHKYEQTL